MIIDKCRYDTLALDFDADFVPKHQKKYQFYQFGWGIERINRRKAENKKIILPVIMLCL